MKSKRLLRFYFCADALEGAIDNLIIKRACTSYSREGEECAEGILKLIAAKDELCLLYNYIKGVMETLKEEEREVLRGYALLRGGVSRLAEERKKAIKRCVIKFVRHARGIENFGEGIRLVNAFYCLLR